MKHQFHISRRTFITTATLGSLAMTVSGMPFPKRNRPLRFGLVTDTHYADREPKNTRFYRESLLKMEEFTDVMNREKVDFVMHLGDFKDEDTHKKPEDTLRYLHEMEEAYGQFNGPRYHCIGNHDVDSITKQQFLSGIENTGVSKDKGYYSFDVQGHHIIVLDANFHADGRDQYYAEGANWQDPNIPDFEMEWLANDLKQNPGPTLVFCHHPLFDFKRGDSNYKVHQYKAVQKLFEAHGHVQAVFQGHVHEERQVQVNDIHYLTQLAMVDYSGMENNSFSLVEVQPNKIIVNGYKRVSSVTL